MSTYWSLIGEKVGLSRSKIDEIYHAEKTDIDRCRAVLHTWLLMKQDVTWDDFLMKIDCHYLKDQVSQIKNVLRMPTNNNTKLPTEVDSKYSSMIHELLDHLTKHPKHFKKLCKVCIKLEISGVIELDISGMYEDPRAFLSALQKNKIISQDNVSWLKYLVKDLPACSKIVKWYDQSIATATNLAIQGWFSDKGGRMEPLT